MGINLVPTDVYMLIIKTNSSDDIVQEKLYSCCIYRTTTVAAYTQTAAPISFEGPILTRIVMPVKVEDC